MFWIVVVLTLVIAVGVLAVAIVRSRKRAQELRSELDGTVARIKEAQAENSRLTASLSQATQSAQALQSQLDSATAQANTLQTENQRLARWKAVEDADAKAAQLIQEAQAVMQSAQADAAAILEDAQRKAAVLTAEADAAAGKVEGEAREQAKALKEQAKSVLDRATVQARAVIEEADKRAQEIAGSAYEAMNKADLYERTVRAMKNIIEGYGDKYLIPSRSLLDGLAESFGHTEAGQALKAARERSAAMVENRTAATCKYVEENRRDTAIEFVMDAFNGKVDSVLSRVKHNNAGTLAQEIKDAFTLVNYNGRAFREAQITQEYLAARLEELKWAAIVQQLLLNEREEQRRIKEQIREEEKARREYERAIREAERDEEALRKAMEKAEQKIAEATAEQRTRYETQLAELTAKLREAEELSQRAKSMAEQTKRGHVYIISNIGSFGEHVYKIGLTRRLVPLDRIRELGDSSVPFDFDVHAMIFSEDAPALEAQLHNHFLMMQMNKVNYRKEFFRVDLAHVREEVTKLGLDAKWTMAADAREYHETLAIEKAIKDDPAKGEAWVKGMLELPPAPARSGAQSDGD